jgi:hypothetical protein
MKTTFSSIDHRPSTIGRRRGFSMLELEVSFAAFGVILAGLCPVVVAELRHAKKLESRFQPGVNYYVVPRPETWSQKLAGTASVTTTGPSSVAASGPRSLTILSLEASPTVEDATAIVQVKLP